MGYIDVGDKWILVTLCWEKTNVKLTDLITDLTELLQSLLTDLTELLQSLFPSEIRTLYSSRKSVFHIIDG